MGLPDRHVVGFDVNVYLDVASLLGASVTTKKVRDAAITYASQVPNMDQKVESLLALTHVDSGVVVNDDTIEVWTSDHIDSLVLSKTTQPNDPSLPDDRRGLGWSQKDASTILDRLVWDTGENSKGASVGSLGVRADGQPSAVPRGRLRLSDQRGRGRLRRSVREMVRHARRGSLRDGPRVNNNYPQAVRPGFLVATIRQERRSGGPRLPRLFLASTR